MQWANIHMTDASSLSASKIYSLNLRLVLNHILYSQDVMSYDISIFDATEAGCSSESFLEQPVLGITVRMLAKSEAP